MPRFEFCFIFEPNILGRHKPMNVVLYISNWNYFDPSLSLSPKTRGFKTGFLGRGHKNKSTDKTRPLLMVTVLKERKTIWCQQPLDSKHQRFLAETFRVRPNLVRVSGNKSTEVTGVL
ncbi:hypothetical protein PoB_006575500 [Plakobranchus ocellatus]|uniref:Uncharacterized protein n=1 Tax=Plakobranchus ocellatus TaxID=259542 RepID=A0AAV4D523_9GAST|nr:hypothetical protein PoB_006575500 [Plakobranchus ocellatus]